MNSSMETSSIKEKIQKFFKGEVRDDLETRKRFSRDASLFVVQPSLIVAPRDIDDIKKLVSFVALQNMAGNRQSLTARSAGTDMSGGPLSESIIVDFLPHFNHIHEVGDGYATTEPGVYYRDFEKETLKRGLLMPSYPASRELCTVGGMSANNSGGELTLQYGKTIDYVQRLKVVLADGNEYTLEPLSGTALQEKLTSPSFEGECYRQLKTLIEKNADTIERARPKVSKNSAGYYLWDVWNQTTGVFDLTKLFVGSQGTLGLTTEITFRLIRRPPKTKMVVVFLDTLGGLGDLVQTILTHNPTTFESYDDKTLRLALSFFGEFIKRLGWKRIFSLFFHSVPEGISILRKGIPHLVLQITFDSENSAELEQKARAMVDDIAHYKPRYVEIIKTPVEVDDYWLIRRESFNLLREKVHGKHTAPFIDDIVVLPDVLPAFLPRLTTILEKYGLLYTIAGHIGNGNFHIIPLMDFRDEKERAKIVTAAKEVYALVAEYHGSITGEHNDGIIRTPFLEGMFGKDMVRLFKETKQIFDSQNIFNPGKKVPSVNSGQEGGDIAYATAHIIKE